MKKKLEYPPPPTRASVSVQAIDKLQNFLMQVHVLLACYVVLDVMNDNLSSSKTFSTAWQ